MIKNWKPEGIGAPVTYAPDRHHGVNGSRMMKAEKGNHVPITDYVIYKPLFKDRFEGLRVQGFKLKTAIECCTLDP